MYFLSYSSIRLSCVCVCMCTYITFVLWCPLGVVTAPTSQEQASSATQPASEPPGQTPATSPGNVNGRSHSFTLFTNGAISTGSSSSDPEEPLLDLKKLLDNSEQWSTPQKIAEFTVNSCKETREPANDEGGPKWIVKYEFNTKTYSNALYEKSERFLIAYRLPRLQEVRSGVYGTMQTLTIVQVMGSYDG